MKEEDLYEIDIPLSFVSSVGTRVHGLACWFDVLFNGSTVQRWLTTAPGSPTTHWYQLRCVLAQPLYVMAGQEITGRLHLVAHSAQSYTIYLTMSGWTPFYSFLLLVVKSIALEFMKLIVPVVF
uniref:type I protein arginine methyltransferase n=1 Tax=Aegilops tauschii subsp. strangulata TaxID=200361 RepID=A0A453AQS7_AEGTS